MSRSMDGGRHLELAVVLGLFDLFEDLRLVSKDQCRDEGACLP